jgi:hypothetical protein
MFTSVRIEITDLKIIINNEHDYLVNFIPTLCIITFALIGLINYLFTFEHQTPQEFLNVLNTPMIFSFIKNVKIISFF